MVKAQEFINKNYPDKTIKQLNISNKNLEGELGLSEFVNLEELDCSDNQLTNLKFADEKKITKLDIRDNYFTQKDLTFLSTFTNLESLKLGRKRVNPSFVLKTMLSHEDRHFNSFGGSLEPLKDMSKLKELSIINTDISEGLEHLPESLERIKCGTTIGREAAYQCSKICEELKNYALGDEEYDLAKWTTENWKKIHPDFTEVQKEWEEKGFSYKQSKQWIDLGFTPSESNHVWWLINIKKQPFDTKLNVEESRKELKEYLKELYQEWGNIHENFKTGWALTWMASGFDYQTTKETREILKEEFEPNSSLVFVTWLRDEKRLTPQEIQQQGITKSLRKEYKKLWIDIHEDFAKDYYGKTYQQKWEEVGLTYQEAKEWISVGLGIENYNSISRLKNAGTTPQQYAESAQKWLDENYSSKKKVKEIFLNEKGGKLIIDDFPNLKRIKSGGMGKQNMINELIISNCPQLEVVDVIYSFAMKELKIINCPNLKKLDCSRSKLTTLDLTNCLNLQAVDCFNNKLKEIKLPLQGGKLEELILNDNKFSAEQDLSFLKDSVNLKTLELGGQGTRGSFCGSLEPLKNMTNLKHLNIKNTNIDSGLEYLPSSLEEIKCYDGLNGKDAKTKKLEEELFFYGNNLKAWQEAHPDLMRHAGKEPVILPYEKVFPEKATTIPEYLQKELDNIDQTWENKYDLSNLDYSNFMLRDERLLSWENNSENNSSTPPQLPLRLYNLKTEEVEETKGRTDIPNYLALSYCWGTDWEDEKERTVTKKDGKTYEVKLTKLGRKALNKVIKTWELINKDKKENVNLDHIWIDNFCINQSDPIEKGQEVANQKQYYSNATATLIAVDAEIGEEVNRENKLELAKHITKKIVTSPWFTRAWTFQEGLLSKQTIFMFDDYLVDGKILALVWSSFQHDYLEPRLRNLNTKPEIFITPFGWSYGAKKEQTFNLSFYQALLAVKHRKQTVALDGIYSILGLLPYGNKVEPNYQPRFCSQCPNQKETKDCSHEEENKKWHDYTKEEIWKALLDVLNCSVQKGYAKEVLAWFGPRSSEPNEWRMPQISEGGVVDIRKVADIEKIETKGLELTENGIKLDGCLHVIDCISAGGSEAVWGEYVALDTTDNASLKIYGINRIKANRSWDEYSENIKVKKEKGDFLVVPNQEWKEKEDNWGWERGFAILVPREKNKDDLINVLEVHYCGRGVGKSRAGKYNEVYEQGELYIDMVNKKVIEGKQAINDYQTQIEIPPKK